MKTFATTSKVKSNPAPMMGQKQNQSRNFSVIQRWVQKMDYAQTATTRWPDRKVSGSGRFALVPMDSAVVLLYGSHREARCQVIDDSRVEIVDLEYTTPVPRKKFIRDLGYE